MKEKLAALQHDIWSHWMRYLFSCCKKSNSGNLIIPKDKVNHWKRQVSLKYDKLSEKEKDNDRDQADKILKLFKSSSKYFLGKRYYQL